MRPEKNDFLVEYLARNIGSYQLWLADKWRCPVCQHEVVVGFANKPLGEHFSPLYGELRKLEHARVGNERCVVYEDVRHRESVKGKE